MILEYMPYKVRHPDRALPCAHTAMLLQRWYLTEWMGVWLGGWGCNVRACTRTARQPAWQPAQRSDDLVGGWPMWGGTLDVGAFALSCNAHQQSPSSLRQTSAVSWRPPGPLLHALPPARQYPSCADGPPLAPPPSPPPPQACEPVLKTLLSAAANAKQNLGMRKAKLVVSECFADSGPVLKRAQPRAQVRCAVRCSPAAGGAPAGVWRADGRAAVGACAAARVAACANARRLIGGAK